MKRLPLHTMLLLAGSATAFAEWTLISDFDNESTAGMTFTNNSDESSLHLFGDSKVDGKAWTILNTAHGTSQGIGFVVFDIPRPVDLNETATLFFQYWQEGTSNNFHVGMTPVPLVIDPETGLPDETVANQPDYWGDYASVMRNDRNVWGLHDGGYRQAGDPAFSVEMDTVYNFWIQYWNETDEYATYVQGGAYTEPTLLQVVYPDSNPPEKYDTALFRNGGTAPLEHVIIARWNNGTGADANLGDPWWVDNLYITYGETVTTNPLDGGNVGGDTFWGYDVVDDAYVSTGDWLGWITVNKAPWIYSYALEKFIFNATDASVDLSSEGGSWFYIPR